MIGAGAETGGSGADKKVDNAEVNNLHSNKRQSIGI